MSRSCQRPSNPVARKPGCFFVFMLAAFASCASLGTSRPTSYDLASIESDTVSSVAEYGEVVPFGVLTLVMPENCSPLRRHRLIRACEEHVKGFQGISGVCTASVVFLTDREAFNVATFPHWSPATGKIERYIRAIGVWCPPNRIACVTGSWDEVPALIHELWHQADPDPWHLSDDWKTVQEEQERITARIRGMRGE